MKITLPKKKDVETPIQIESSRMVIIGANGSGKTRFGSKIEESYLKSTLRIAAQKSLTMPKEVSPKSREKAQNEFWYGHGSEDKNWLENHGKLHGRWQSDFNISLLNDFDKLMVLLHTEEYEESLRYKEGEIEKPITKLDRLQKLWEDVLPHRKLFKRAGTIQTYPGDKPEEKYNSSQMSDGERVIFYFIGEVMCSKLNSIIIIDEPEVHLHKSVSAKLWDAIENERPDCTYIYLTHDIDFATSRTDAITIWIKSYHENNTWDYEVIEHESPLPEQVYLEILGSRKPILFFEGANCSKDKKLLEQVYTEFTIKPLGSCEKILNSTKSFNDLNSFHNIKAFGIIDRDRRSEEEIEHIKNPNIWVARVAEIENFLLLEKVIKVVAQHMKKNEDIVFNSVKENVIDFFSSQLDTQALEHTIARIERVFKTVTNNKTAKTITELESQLNQFWAEKDFTAIFNATRHSFRLLVETKNYNGILMVFNNKGIISKSNVANLCDLKQKNDAYLNLIISIIREGGEGSSVIKSSIQEMIQR
jgi:hypothetical protein